MGAKYFLLVCATLSWCFLTVAARAQGGTVQIPLTRFTCQGRGSGYYADVDTGCQVYHMCDGLGRQFSYTCPNTTLFQQRMLICDHWYMVNCSMSERDYSANLLIGQRDKPFVSEEEMRLRTPRPDILSVPPNSNYYDGLREAESKFPLHPGNSIVGVPDSISSDKHSGLDSAKHNYRPPTSWSTGTGVRRPGNSGVKGQGSTGNTESNNRPSRRPSGNNNREHDQRPENTITNQRPNSNLNSGGNNEDSHDNLAGAASLKPGPTFHPTSEDHTQKTRVPNFTPPNQELSPPFPPPTTTSEPPSSEEFEIDVRMKDTKEDPVFNFIKRFDPNSPDSHKTAMTKTEIINLNEQLPAGQVSSEEDRTPRKNKNTGNNFNIVRNENKGFVEGSRFENVNVKPTNPTLTTTDDRFNNIPTPDRELLPPKTNYSEQPSTTMGPPVYYEWKWAAPAFDLEPPKEDNKTQNTQTNQSTNPQGKRNISGRSPFSSVTRPTPVDFEPLPPTKNTEYNTSSYFIPDFVFPLDKAHPGYDDDEAQTSFQVKVARPGRASYGENPACPHCHPAYLKPGTCEPCLVKR